MIKKIDFSKYSSIKIGPIANIKVIEKLGDYEGYCIIGKANNILVSNNHPKFAVLGSNFDYIKQKKDKLFVGCATSTGKLLSYCKKNNIGNLEFLAKLPGTMGGVVKMNAGLKSWEIFNHLICIKTKDRYINKKDIEHSYRKTKIKTVIYEVVLKIKDGFNKEKVKEFNKMRNNQPQIASAGSCFKNPKNDFAGRLIEEVNLKGFKKGGLCFSQQHANFLVNSGNGTFEEAIFLINLAKKRVKEKFDIILEEEIVIY